MEWALSSEPVPAAEMERFSVVNHVIDDARLVAQATAFARKVATGPTKAHAAHKALLRTWAVGGVAAADEAMFDIAIPLWSTDDTGTAIPAAVAAMKAGQPRPAMPFTGS
jgi:enoyl-CoA hydratase/carnithine racemase